MCAHVCFCWCDVQTYIHIVMVILVINLTEFGVSKRHTFEDICEGVS